MIKVTRREPDERTAMFSTHVSLGNSYTNRVGSSARLNDVMAQRDHAKIEGCILGKKG